MQGSSITGNRSVTRDGGMPAFHTIPLAYNTSGISTSVKVPGLGIGASTQEPMQVRVQYQDIAAFAPATNVVVSIGTTTAANEWVSATNIGASTYSPSTPSAFRLIADTNVYVKVTVTGAAATAGTGQFYLTIQPENTIPIV